MIARGAVQRKLGMLLLLACLTGGCATYRVELPDSDPHEPEYRKETMHAFFWGALMQPEVLAAEGEGQGINEVWIERTLLHDVISVATLGVWMPIDVKYRLRGSEVINGPFPVDDDEQDDADVR